MKKIILFFAGIALLTNNLEAQAFHKGAIVFDLGAGVTVYKTTIQDEYNSQVWNGSYLTTIRKRIDTTNNAGAAVYPLTIEYGLKNWLGVAARVAYSNYFAEKDSLSGIKTAVRGIDAGLVFNLHLLKTKRFDLPIGLTIGYSNFELASKDSLSSMAKDNGFNYGFAAVPHFYFGEHIGLSVSLGYMVYTYPSILFSNRNDANINDNTNRVFKLEADGASIGLNLVVKF